MTSECYYSSLSKYDENLAGKNCVGCVKSDYQNCSLFSETYKKQSEKAEMPNLINRLILSKMGAMK